MDILGIALIAALVKKGLDLIRYVRANDVNGYVTLGASLVLGVLATILVAQTSFAGGVEFGGVSLSDMNVWSQIVVGLTAAATAAIATDAIKAADNTQSAAVPSLVTGEPKSTDMP